MIWNKFLASLLTMSLATCFMACSQTSSSSADDEDDISADSSSGKSKGDASDEVSSSSVEEDYGDDCVGTPGQPWDGTTAKAFACGTGTKLSPYIILTAEQLAHLSFVVGAKESEYDEKYFKLGADILLNKGSLIDEKGALVADSTKLHKWTPIGNSSVTFTGNFDGNNHTVSGMFINTTSTHNGLFGNVSGTVQNLIVKDSWVSGGKNTAGVVGYSVGMVENVQNSASVNGIDECVGGVLGNSSQKDYRENSVIRNVVNEGFVMGNKNVGGVVGCASHVTLDGAVNKAIVDGNDYVGGVIGGIGSTDKNDLKNLRNYANIKGVHFVGGVSGFCGGNPYVSSFYNEASYSCSKLGSYQCGKILNMYNGGSVTGENYVGGVLGMVCYGSISSAGNVADVVGEYGTAGIVGSASYVTSVSLYNTGNILGEDYVGGIFSYNKEGVTSSAYSIGKVDGDSLVGLMIGHNYNTTMADYYYLEQGEQEPFGLNDGGGVATPKSSKEMKSNEFAKLLGEDFVYDSGLNNGFPILSWEK
ncbi:MAG: hypothetical protein MJY47_07865 [Fibrobacter sp.]|nr:hypothetical protein [Fibrobacter sp.]